jgi:hypothetical protein
MELKTRLRIGLISFALTILSGEMVSFMLHGPSGSTFI